MKTQIGIRCEDKNRWERRTPLIPTHIRDLLQSQLIEVRIQPSSIRIFPDEIFTREGAVVTEDLSPCSIIFAVKEIPLDFFEQDKVYIFFSHTTKGQPHNMPMLKKMIEHGCTLIDYEKIVNEKGERLLFFGHQAGQAGMIDTLWALGQRLNNQGIENPFSEVRQAYQYQSLLEAKELIEKVGWKIKDNGLDPSLTPCVCGFAGYGHVSRGAQDIFHLLPFEEIEPEEIDSLFRDKNYSANRLYKVIFMEKHMVKPLASDQEFELQDYYDNPQKYESIFESYLPYLTLLVNCIYWTPKYPRFVTKNYLKKLFSSGKEPRLRAIGDVSCDIEGSVECTVYATSPDNPVFVYDPIEGTARDGVEGRGLVVMAVDNLPAEIPLESSVFFSSALKPLVLDIAKADFSGNFNDCNLPDVVRKAVILHRGEFTPDYEYMKNFIQ